MNDEHKHNDDDQEQHMTANDDKDIDKDLDQTIEDTEKAEEASAEADEATETADGGDGNRPAEAGDDQPAVPYGIVYDDAEEDHKPALDQTDALIAAALGLPADGAAKAAATKDAKPASAEKPAEAAPVMVASKIDKEISRKDSVVFSTYPTLAFKHVGYAYKKNGPKALDAVDLAFYDRRVYAVVPSSDEQRVTLLGLMTAMLRPTDGRVMFKSKDLEEITGNEFRGHFAGLVLQRNSLRGDLTALDNIVNAMEASGRNFLKPKPLIAEDLLEEVGFPSEHNGTPARELPDIYLRRVAIAKALSCEPAMIIADEPVAGLEDPTRGDIIALLRRIAHKENKTVVIVTTDADLAHDAADKIYTL
ncbi:ATP-binding cassette domain-containing protein [Bifidobacterium avesanii]|uniref:ATP-binding cassette domain-containing protein n=1 Tax=Bifidobacterium avesanii TaxID=1798157 RepID=A0A7K3TJA5_9BIFI|nr:ATP-binding cassette domain-containing protein [Bifidobacterium avesanii]KAB8287395.1 ABC transporter ATP-binding protein [Bifidobacterium avesanii]NEG78690.1 ATP-binding cassette domain-containing protein [Bifidobacterium avesanii]